MGREQFLIHGAHRPLSIADALYFSVITLATVGYGDIVPQGALVRALAAAEVVCGVLLRLFGFGEIMRARDTLRAHDHKVAAHKLPPRAGDAPD